MSTRDLTVTLRLAAASLAPLEAIRDAMEAIAEKQAEMLKSINATNGHLQTTIVIIRRVRGGLDDTATGWDKFKQALLQAQIGARAIEKISDGIQQGVGTAFEKIAGMGSQAFGFVGKRFKEAMADEIADIQATGSVFGSLQQNGMVKSGSEGYKQAKMVYRQMDQAIGEEVKRSTAPTEMIVNFSRSLSDNILPELVRPMIESGQTLEQAVGPASKSLASLYESMALLTPSGYSPGMVSKSVQKALQGESAASLARYDFFQLNPIVLSTMKKQGFFTAKTIQARLKIFTESLKTALDPRAIREMRESISGGLQGLNDTLVNPTVGIFSFARTWDNTFEGKAMKVDIERQVRRQMGNTMEQGKFRLLKDETLEEYLQGIQTPIKLIGSTVGPFLQALANLLGGGGTIMGHLAVLFNKYIGPILLALTDNAKFLSYDVGKQKKTFAFALGRMMAEIVKQVSQLFKIGDAATDINSGLNQFINDFMKGFNDLGYTINWEAIGQKITDVLVGTLFLPGMREVLGTLFIAFAAPAVISALFSAITLMLMVPISTYLTAVTIPAITAAFTPILGALGSIVALVLSPIGILIAIAVAAVAVLVLYFVRYREQIALETEKFNAVWAARWKELDLTLQLQVQRFANWIATGLDSIINFLRKIPGVSGLIDESRLSDRTGAEEAAVRKARDEVTKEKNVAIEEHKKAVDALESAVGKDMQMLGKMAADMGAKLGQVATVGFKAINSGIKSMVGNIDSWGGGVKAAKNATKTAIQSNTKTTSAINSNIAATVKGAYDVVSSVGKAESAIGKISMGGGGMGGPMVKLEGGKNLSETVVTSMKRPGHAGIDFGVPSGTSVALNMPGTVSTAAFTDGACGGMIAGKFSDGVPFKFCHMSQIGVQAGQQVGAGMVIGKSGGGKGEKGAGRSTGPHIHLLKVA